MALGGVDMGSIKAQLEASATGIPRSKNSIPIPPVIPKRIIQQNTRKVNLLSRVVKPIDLFLDPHQKEHFGNTANA